tara:strand:+ start:2191 stop:4275 length:2085 start_codon:yes stop_codon:yes gene_type:complete
MIPFKKNKLYLYFLSLLYFVFFLCLCTSIVLSNDNNEILINADKIEVNNDDERVTASGNVNIITDNILSSSDNFVYQKSDERITASGNIIVKDKIGNYYYFDNFISDKKFDEAIGTNTKIRLKDGSRIAGNLFTRKNAKINQINNASYTPCNSANYLLKDCPGWKLNANKVIHDSEKQNIYYEGATLSILNIPVLYTPFFSHPDPTVKKRSGLLMPSIASDNVLGTSFSLSFFYNIASNYDLTFTPTIQTKSDNYYSLDYRHLTKNHKLNINSSISDNESKSGTKNHIFIDGAIKNPFGKFDYKIQTSNNDTYLRKNYINDLTILTSGLNFTKEMDNSYLDFSSYIYKHLNNPSDQKWEYIYPMVNYDIYNYKDKIYGLNWQIKNSLLNYRDINKNYNQQISTEINSTEINISRKTGLRFENTIQSRLTYFNNSANNLNQIRAFPQFSSKVSYPLNKRTNNRNEVLEPIIMPIFAPYNNYKNEQKISNSNIFSLNRETSLSQWESGPRINYGINWLIDNNSYSINTSIGQSARENKNGRSNVSDYFIGNIIDFGSAGYIKTDITIDRKHLYLKDNNINTSLNLGKIKFGFDYDYETLEKVKTSEQISVGAKLSLFKDTKFITSVRKNLMTDKSIGNSFGAHYENDCLAINFDYFRDFTAVDDITDSHGFSFTITLKPFGTSKQAGKVRNFGPDL